jgi:hypothetical protein
VTRFRLPLALILVLLASAAVRGANHLRRSVLPGGDPAAGWFCTDPDSLYHMRRVDRFLEDGRVASTDPLLGTPLADTPGDASGTAIPWPPAYTYVAGLFCSPDAESGSAEHRRALEQRIASLPFWFGIATSFLIALAAAGLAARGRRRILGLSAGDVSGLACVSPASAALVAGLYHAFAFGSLKYSHLGTGDHHAFVSFLTAAMLLCLSRAMGDADAAYRETGARPARPGAVAIGLGAGAIAGLLLGTWVAGLTVLVLMEAALAWALVTAAPERVRPLANFGLALHLTALAVLISALAASPWWDLEPWSVVNLSRYHAAHLLAGSAVCLAARWAFPSAARGRRVAVFAIQGVALFIFALLTPLGASLREAFDWAGARDPFMAAVQESQALFGSVGNPDSGPALAARHLGWGLFAAPLAWWALRPRTRTGYGPAAVGWWIALPPLFLAAILQRRFADLALVPLALALGLWIPTLLNRIPRSPLARLLAPALLVALPLAAHGRVVVTTAGRLGTPEPYPETAEAIRERGRRELYGWLRNQDPPAGAGRGFTERGGDQGTLRPVSGVEVGEVGSQRGTSPRDPVGDPRDVPRVLAQWDLGHAIEWVAGRGTVASNFGAYIGEEAHLAPWRFFLTDDVETAEAILEETGARWVLVTDSFERNLATAASRLGLTQERATEPDRMWRRLMEDGRGLDGTSLPFLRLVHLSPVQHQRTTHRGRPGGSEMGLPAGWIWERVPGARVEVSGEPGARFELRFTVDFPDAQHRLEWVGKAVLAADGRASLRVPYGMDHAARWHLVWSSGNRSGELVVSEAAVAEGRLLTIP